MQMRVLLMIHDHSSTPKGGKGEYWDACAESDEASVSLVIACRCWRRSLFRLLRVDFRAESTSFRCARAVSKISRSSTRRRPSERSRLQHHAESEDPDDLTIDPRSQGREIFTTESLSLAFAERKVS